MPEEARRPRPGGGADVRAAGARLPASTRPSRSSSSPTATPAARSPSARSTPTRSPARKSAGRARPLGRGRRAPRRRPRAGGGAGRRRPPAASALARSRSRSPGATRSELEERVERLRECYGRVQLHRPGGEQHRLFLASLPAADLPAARVQGAPAARPARGDGPARDQPRRLADRPLHRPHADRLAPPGPVRPRRGLPAEPPADLPARRQPRLGQDDLPRAGGLAGLPAGLGPDRRHRPQGRPPPRRPARRRRGRSRRSSSPATSATAACSTRCGSARRGDPRGPRLQLPRLDPAGAGQAGVADAAAPGDLRGGRGRRAQLRRGAARG